MKHWVLVLLLFSCIVKADFNHTGDLQLHLLNGDQRSQAFVMSLTTEAGAYLFQVGTQSARLPSPPQKYSLSLVLQQDREVWVTDFANQALQAFTLTIANYQFSLKQDPIATNARGRFVLQIGEESYYFGRGPAQINFLLNENGITEIEIRGMFKPRR